MEKEKAEKETKEPLEEENKNFEKKREKLEDEQKKALEQAEKKREAFVSYLKKMKIERSESNFKSGANKRKVWMKENAESSLVVWMKKELSIRDDLYFDRQAVQFGSFAEVFPNKRAFSASEEGEDNISENLSSSKEQQKKKKNKKNNMLQKNIHIRRKSEVKMQMCFKIGEAEVSQPYLPFPSTSASSSSSKPHSHSHSSKSSHSKPSSSTTTLSPSSTAVPTASSLSSSSSSSSISSSSSASQNASVFKQFFHPRQPLVQTHKKHSGHTHKPISTAHTCSTLSQNASEIKRQNKKPEAS
ncbi:uncharacterized protein MONOS_16032 [Monocercomonoides exilis]|uniref:uncharacterized protein n=1 Tax=Monocercomonoides exilis TaxID=2049356 RepID=UPI00355A2AA8|nr:hypothetical protein MONOS_16032 [Monocercomonoides exilis]|eukprot:MONOS_16032.1-p1 / transcript=MONOS_16032.1 / gene=MONOS_16032 / organism=Monocercomonoides_exilis_PA203 / gene_product=unspecified product / transcript_product=unspecified product / location=Mono_scaffold01467:2637-3702(+) / protein_length=301 / sequence_SO=supercontig / SO=protein_coding / is_pseudo=false